MAEVFEVSVVNGEGYALFVAAGIYVTLVFSPQVWASEHETATAPTPPALSPPERQMPLDVVLSVVDQVEPPQLPPAFVQFFEYICHTFQHS